MGLINTADNNQQITLILDALQRLRAQKPLVLNITNYVVMNNTANALLAIGASPIMAHSREEMAEMLSFSGALVINIGTLDSVLTSRIAFAIEQANANNRPVILDPVGCGASHFRTETSRQIAAAAASLIIRGNASEIMALAGDTGNNKGVDALDPSFAALDAAKHLVSTYQCNVVISGVSDFIVSKDRVIQLDNGHAMMPYVTGMGCSLSALTGAFAAVGETSGLAAAAIFAIAGEIAAEQSQGPGSLQVNILDALYQLDEATISAQLRLTCL